jgi:hypothetical protein
MRVFIAITLRPLTMPRELEICYSLGKNLLLENPKFSHVQSVFLPTT